jgi:hypothetical protein
LPLEPTHKGVTIHLVVAHGFLSVGASGRTRTGTQGAADFKSAVSTNSTTLAD